MNLLHKIALSTLLAIGLIHIVFGFLTFKEYDMGFLWFVGSGLAKIFCSLLSLTFSFNRQHPLTYYAAQLSTFLLLIFVIAIDFIMPMLPGFVGLAALLAMAWSQYRLKVTSNPV